MIENFEFIVATPVASDDATVAIAASRTGAQSILDLTATSVARARTLLARMQRYGRGRLGVRLMPADSDILALINGLAERELLLVVRAGDCDAAALSRLRDQFPVLWVECTSLAEARLAVAAKANAIIAKGNEAGGWIGEETTFILLQRIVQAVSLPVYAQGGIGQYTIAAAAVAGAAGVVLCDQLLLLRESGLPLHVKQAVAYMDGSETIQLGSELGRPFRAFKRPQAQALAQLETAAATANPTDRDGWQQAVAARIGWGDLQRNVWPLGQDAAFAKELADKYGNISRLLSGLQAQLEGQLNSAVAHRPLAANSPLATSHRTAYPIVQGPMTRVSDRAPFAKSVADGGGLPFLALSMMRAAEVDELMQETAQLLGDQSWGVGILGFVPLDLRREQLDVIKRHRPPFALIAGGRPDQAQQLEQLGIQTYLHVPSPGLLDMFVQNGARRFIFEGKECGGHIGPRSSFVLWELMIETLLAAALDDPQNVHVLFAGGIHDAISAAMVAALAAPLVERGMKIGVLMGTGYLFTREAVSTGAILPGFQDAALEADRTVTVESGAGHAIRCVENPFTTEFSELKRSWLRDGVPADQVRHKLDALNIGRLRIASKGITRHPNYRRDPSVPKFIEMSHDQQREQGMYMIGQLAALRNDVVTIDDLHQSVAIAGSAWLDRFAVQRDERQFDSTKAQPANIAIVGLECVLPKAADKQQYWHNIVNSVYAIGEVPPERWPVDLYFDAQQRAKDKIYSKWGGFIDEVSFDPLEFGMPPAALKAIDPMQLLALKVAKLALADAGIADDPELRQRTGVILGVSGGLGDIGSYYLLRSLLPMVVGDQAEQLLDQADWLPQWTEDSFAGLLPNVSAGRIANRLDFGGVNYVVDAACGSSLAAVHLAVRELESGNCDAVVVGGVDTIQSPFGYMCFSQTGALSPHGLPRVFDDRADGITISEGVVMLVLKRLADAERDGDRIYAVIQGAAGSSDGRALGLTAPRPEGQRLALQRAYERAGIDPTTVDLFEAHGTGTARGDRTEAKSLGDYLQQQGAAPNRHAVGSVKSMIGHTKAAAGVAGLSKIALALYHKILPPTLNVEIPNKKANFGSGPLYINAKARPWIHAADQPRRGGVSAFGFGGTNFHVVVEAYDNYLKQPAPLQQWPSELLLWSAEALPALEQQLTELHKILGDGAKPKLAELAQMLWRSFDSDLPYRLAIVAESIYDLQQQLAKLLPIPANAFDDNALIATPNANVFSSKRRSNGSIALLFPGQGAQKVDMLADLAMTFDEVRSAFEEADTALAGRYDRPLSHFIFPPPSFDEETQQQQQQQLTETNIAQAALGAAEVGSLSLLRNLGIKADMAAGHSYGEYVALYAANVIDSAALYRLSERRGSCMIDAAKDGLGGMAAVSGDEAAVERAIADLEEVWVANLNAPTQTIIAGSDAGIERALTQLKAHGLRAQPINVAAAFHSPIVAPAGEAFAHYLADESFSEPQFDVYSNTTARPHSLETVRTTLVEHLAQPVRFVDQIQQMADAGAQIFIECGPGNILTRLTNKILDDNVHLALNIDHGQRHGVTQLLLAVAQLAVVGVPVDLDRLFTGRDLRPLSLNRLLVETRPQPIAPTTWLVNGGFARPSSAEPVIPQPPTPMAAAATMSMQPEPAKTPAPQAAAPVMPIAAAPSSAGGVSDPAIVSHYHDLMSHFLQTQRQVMMAALAPVQTPQRASQPPAADTTSARQTHAATGPQSQPKATAAPSVTRTLLQTTRSAVGPGGGLKLSKRYPIAISDDGAGIAQQVAARIERAGGRAIIITGDELPDNVGGLIHLAPIGNTVPFEALDLEKWQRFSEQNVTQLLSHSQQLNRSTAPNRFLAAVTNCGAQPLHGGVEGFLKTAGQELAEIRVLWLDCDDLQQVAAQLWSELDAQQPSTAVQYRAGERTIWRSTVKPLNVTGQPNITLGAEDVILITGGARGITAEAALALAERSQPVLILVGRSPLPPQAEAEATRTFGDGTQLKQALLQQMQSQQPQVSIADVEKRYRQLLKEREVRSNIQRLQRAGATIRYHAADVRDVQAVKLIVEMTELEFGPITGVIHGAGIIDDRLISAKSADSFERVFATKVDSAFILSRLIRSDHLKFMLFFSSVAGAYGNPGQCDYAAANAVLNRLAAYLDQQLAATVRAICWGPWRETGMVSEALERQFADRGIELIDPRAGVAALLEELQFGQQSIVIRSQGWDFDIVDAAATADAAMRPLVVASRLSRQAQLFEASRLFELDSDRYLDHHRLDGKPVLPLAVATEWLAEVAEQGWPGLFVHEIRDLRVLQPLKFENDRPLQLRAMAVARPSNDERTIVDMALVAADDRDSYRCVVELRPQPPQAELYDALPANLQPFEHSVAELYERWLFHGPLFQAITEIVGYSADELLLRLEPAPADLVIAGSRGEWLIDPIAFDAGLQGALIWSRYLKDVTPIPLGFGTLRRFEPPDERSAGPLYAHLTFDTEIGGNRLLATIALVDSAGSLLLHVTGVEGQASAAFNRLGGKETYRPLQQKLQQR